MNLTAPPSNGLGEIIKRLVAWGLPQDDVAYTLHGAVTERMVPPRTYLFQQDTPVDTVYVLVSGKLYQERIVETDRGRRVVLRRDVRPGEWLGHYDLLFTQQYATRVRAVEPSELIVIQASALSRLIYRYPRIRQQMAPMETIGRLRTLPLFGGLELPILSYIADACRAERIPPYTELYAQGQPANEIFIIDQGQVVLTGDHYQTWRAGNGMTFGFLEGPPVGRRAGTRPYDHSAQTLIPSSFFVIDRTLLFDLADLDPEAIGPQLRRQAEAALESVTIFANYTREERRILLGYMSHYFIPIPHLIMQQGELGDSLWILMPGSRATLFALHDSQGLQPAMVQGPNFFGELALRVHHTLNSTVQAEPGSQWLRLHVEDFQAFQAEYGADLGTRLSLSPAAEHYLGEAQARQRYSWLQAGENLVLFQRRHLLALLRNVAVSLILSLILVIFWATLAAQGWLAPPFLWIIGILGGVSALQFAWGLIDYLNDYLLVTNQRLVRQEKVLFMAEWRQAAFLEQIQSVEVATGFWGKVLKFGILRVQTAATQGAITFDLVPDPLEIKQTILEQQNLRKQNYQASSKMVIQNLLEERFGLRLRLPPHVHPPTNVPSIQLAGNWRDRLAHALDVSAHLEMRVKDRIIWRKHWLVLLARIAPAALILLGCLAVIAGGFWVPASLRGIVQAVDLLLVLLGLVMVVWIGWLTADWRNDRYEVDDRQIADIRKKPLFFSEQRRTAFLGEIENIEINIPSPIHFLFNFGHVRLQTAAQEGNFDFDWVPNPRGVSEEIRRRIEIYRYQQESTRARQRAQELPDWFEMYARLGAETLPTLPRRQD